jgi:hypothetical protein
MQLFMQKLDLITDTMHYAVFGLNEGKGIGDLLDILFGQYIFAPHQMSQN